VHGRRRALLDHGYTEPIQPVSGEHEMPPIPVGTDIRKPAVTPLNILPAAKLKD